MSSAIIPEFFLIAVIIKPIILSLCSAILFALFYSIYKDGVYMSGVIFKNVCIILGYSLPVVMLAFNTGYLTGISRSAAVGSVLPAVLSLIGGALLYVFGTENRFKTIIAYCVLMFSVGLLYGAQSGALERQIGFETRVKILSEQEERIRNFRSDLGINESPPPWILPPKEDK